MRKLPLVLFGALALIGVASAARAMEGFIHTGSGIRVKKVLFVKAQVYEISHYMRRLPEQRTRKAVIEADIDKVAAWRMLREVDEGKIRDSMKSAYALNGYREDATINKVFNVFSGGLQKGEDFKVTYDSQTKTTTFSRATGRRVSIAGLEFMRATWSMWFGQSDQPGLGDDLLCLVR